MTMPAKNSSKISPTHFSCGGIITRTSKGEKEIILLHRLKSSDWQYDSWHIPKGTKDGDETDEETVKRELFEETGFVVRVGEKVGVLHSTYERDGQTINKQTTYFHCEAIERKSEIVTEHDELKWVPLTEAIRLVKAFPIYEKEEEILQLLAIH